MDIPYCHGMEELPSTSAERAKVLKYLSSHPADNEIVKTPLFVHLSHGLAYTVGSALGSVPPDLDTCLAAFLVPNKAGLTVGARAWSKHFHRSQAADATSAERGRREMSAGWWGSPCGPVSIINEKAVALFWKVMSGASWRNLHWLPHQILVYEIRVPDGYGMRWSQDQSAREGEEDVADRAWKFRGFVEPMMENGHEIGWRH
ncbi:hypothetical protein D9615_004209 [Tricholomella constricta]|uniref:Uncharacterized protein n=1 Tax=Tricholomella constricta TaxID=117010 RepID=A0A8H5M631_9AGAR|nr:hypothetical protein D9615_004209 [Tricholomella constricta]